MARKNLYKNLNQICRKKVLFICKFNSFYTQYYPFSGEKVGNIIHLYLILQNSNDSSVGDNPDTTISKIVDDDNE